MVNRAASLVGCRVVANRAASLGCPVVANRAEFLAAGLPDYPVEFLGDDQNKSDSRRCDACEYAWPREHARGVRLTMSASVRRERNDSVLRHAANTNSSSCGPARRSYPTYAAGELPAN